MRKMKRRGFPWDIRFSSFSFLPPSSPAPPFPVSFLSSLDTPTCHSRTPKPRPGQLYCPLSLYTHAFQSQIDSWHWSALVLCLFGQLILSPPTRTTLKTLYFLQNSLSHSSASPILLGKLGLSVGNALPSPPQSCKPPPFPLFLFM